METTNKKVRIRLTSKMLGTVPKDKEVYATHIATKKRDMTTEELDKELETIEEIEEKGWTGFHKNENGIFIYSYMIKGFLKSATGVLMATGTIKKIPAYKKWFDLLVFVSPKEISLDGKTEPDGILERSIRMMTPAGPRTALARSDVVNAGTELEFEIKLLKNTKKIDMDLIDLCLGYGGYVGLGQWRGSGGYGQFEVIAE